MKDLELHYQVCFAEKLTRNFVLNFHAFKIEHSWYF